MEQVLVFCFFVFSSNLVFLSSGCAFVSGKHNCTMKHSDFFSPPHYFQVYIPFLSALLKDQFLNFIFYRFNFLWCYFCYKHSTQSLISLLCCQLPSSLYLILWKFLLLSTYILHDYVFNTGPLCNIFKFTHGTQVYVSFEMIHLSTSFIFGYLKCISFLNL